MREGHHDANQSNWATERKAVAPFQSSDPMHVQDEHSWFQLSSSCELDEVYARLSDMCICVHVSLNVYIYISIYIYKNKTQNELYIYRLFWGYTSDTHIYTKLFGDMISHILYIYRYIIIKLFIHVQICNWWGKHRCQPIYSICCPCQVNLCLVRYIHIEIRVM